ncbi:MULTISPECIES: XdhC family protein [unclassified Sphingobium]|uniref:XdhC family protein n=1 Tax=unclassified Sphingobium TaxID=2611147 RepID=UPI000D174409|nr:MULTISPECIES: XdhC family protein [unclassified Sphingobium]MBG6117647.1 xanthine dehydrogenase accessory factor [Sphingobium sp. JAI105]PSO12724.1 XshC-Cox1-family protein [Sphingobium sp. AEW4]TWD09920.1 xanthine dehydrogenase accessory factor [Sphingobium sp. AEW010]TWD26591.1 xanthine dehydrogenase accessory factor [Sphingobium sp. AEW013]TWD27640.1 xanthine dehydrogenase accessory factor [Sphingobium sp. AEW001]
MNDNGAVIRKGVEWRGAKLALATVVSTWGSAPRPRGSHMIVHQDGRFEGSISGGCVESDVLHRAAEVIAGRAAHVATYGVADGDAWDVGLPCGGEIAVLIQPVGADGFAPDLFDRIEAASARGRALTLATDLATGVTREQASEGDFLNRYDPPRRLLIVGAVQIAQSLVPLAQAIGVTPVVIDPRGRFLTAERFPGVELDDRWPDEAITARFPGESTAVVTLSHDIKIDDPALEAALRAPTGYVAALGSRKSHAARLERLAAQGFDAGDLARIDGPAGLDIGAVGAAEIALSITAGMVAGFNARR